MKLIVCTGYYGHVELAPEDVVKGGKFNGLTQRQMFEQIMKEGYGNNIPAVFHAEYHDGAIRMFKGRDAAGLIDDPSVREVTVIAPIAGGDLFIFDRLTLSFKERDGVRMGFLERDQACTLVRVGFFEKNARMGLR